MISFKHSGDFRNTERFLKKMTDFEFSRILEKYAFEGLISLMSATPVDSALTANSWGYQIVISRDKAAIYWTNSNVVDGVPIVILLQYGHGTRGGAYVQGRDFINPAIKPVFDKIVSEIWKEVSRA